MKDVQNDHSTVQTVQVPGRSSEVGSVLVSLLACALSVASLVVSIANLYTLLKLIRIITPILIPAQ